MLAAVSAALGASLAIVFLSIPAGGGSTLPFLLLSLITVVLFAGVALIIVQVGSRMVLTVAPDGVEYRSLGYRLVAPWSEVESVDSVILGAMSGVGLNLRHDALAAGGGWVRIAGLLDVSTMFGPSYDRLIPLEPFAKPLAGSQLLADIRRYIPDLVAAYEERKAR